MQETPSSGRSISELLPLHAPGAHHDIRGHRLWVEQEGEGEPVLLLSGFGPAGSHLVFHPQFSDLAADYRIIYVDLLGRGRSDPPVDLNDITFDSDEADIVALIEVLGLGQVHIYGFSYGGLLGQAVALDHPSLVRTLTVANSLHSPEMWQQNHANINRELANQYPEVWARIQALHAEGVPSTDARLRREFSVASRLVRFYHPDNADRLLDEPGARNQELYRMFCGADVDFIIGEQLSRIPDFRPRLKNLTIPLLILAGRYDRALYPALQIQFAASAPGAQLRFLEHSGSFGHIEEPEEVFKAFREFLRRG